MTMIFRYDLCDAVPSRDLVQLALTMRGALVSLSDGHATFTGRDDDHRHVYVLPRVGNHLVDQVHLVTPGAPKTGDGSAIMRLGHVTMRGRKIQLVLRDVESSSPGGVTWVSSTPFFTTTHPKCTRRGSPKLDTYGRQRGGPAHDAARLLALLGIVVDFIETVPWNPRIDLSGLAGVRGPGGPVRLSVTLREAHVGPLAIGYGAHYGLGQLAPGRAA